MKVAIYARVSTEEQAEGSKGKSPDPEDRVDFMGAVPIKRFCQMHQHLKGLADNSLDWIWFISHGSPIGGKPAIGGLTLNRKVMNVANKQAVPVFREPSLYQADVGSNLCAVARSEVAAIHTSRSLLLC